jgi:gamma-glutamyl:cysteine ligase YbdK (ATP-grasp superfamily)
LRYRLFEVTGIEIEYAVVGKGLQALRLVEPAFRALNGRPTSELRLGPVEFSHEFPAHQFEIRTAAPKRRLAVSERLLVAGVRRFARLLRERFGARLLPTGMHPFLRPGDAALWPRGRHAIFQAYARLFPVRTHGFMNVQASHVNLPFGRDEADGVALHNAICCLLPYLPALAASSPAYEGRLGPWVDNRLAFYRTMQRRLPEVTGRVIPEFIQSFRQYRRDVLGPIRRSLRRRPWAWRLQPEWVNSRGAIVRFHRRAIEIRVLDVQECVRADIAIAAFVRGVLQWLTRTIRHHELELPPHAALVRDFEACARAGRNALVGAPHLRQGSRPIPARRVLEILCDRATPEPGHYQPVVEQRIERGNLSERIARAVRRRTRGNSRHLRPALLDVYTELANCLERNQLWNG